MQPPAIPGRPSPLLSADRWKDIIKIVLALVLIGYVLSKTSLQQVLGLKEYISWSWLGVSFALFFLTTLIKAFQYWTLLGRHTSYHETLKIVIIQNAVTNFIANAAGITSYLALFRMEQNVNIRRSGAVFLLTKAGDILSMGLFLLISALLVWARVMVFRQLVMLLLVGTALGLIGFWAVIFFRQRIIHWAQEISIRFHMEHFSPIKIVLSSLESLSTQDTQTITGILLRGGTSSLFYMTATMIYFYSRMQAFQIPLDFWGIIFIAAVMQFISIIPLQVFGGLGVTEISLVYLYGIFGVTQDIPAILVSLRLLFYLFNLVLFSYIPLDAMVNRLLKNKDVH